MTQYLERFDRERAAMSQPAKSQLPAPSAMPLPVANDGEYRLLANSIPQMVWRADPKGNIDYLSEQWYAYTGITRPHFQRLSSLNEDWLSVIHADDVEAFSHAWTQSVKSGTRFEAECRIHRAGNGYCWHLSRAIPVCDKHKRILSWFGTSTFMDNERRKIEDMASECRARDRFLTLLSGAMRKPQTPALLAIATLEADATLPAPAREQIAILSRSIHAQTALIADLTDISSATHGKLPLRREAVDLHDIAHHALEYCIAELNIKNITLSKALNATYTIVVGDPARLRQLLCNLFKNAAKFTPDRGHVEIGTSNAAENRVRFWVKDDGVGVSPDKMGRLFEPFERSGETFPDGTYGLGLGLAIARIIAESHQGNLFCVSDGVGLGATFVLELPLLPSDRIPSDFESFDLTPAARSSRHLNILLVEDHADTALAMKHLLNSFGHTVEATSTADAALLSASSRTYDLVITSIESGDKGGADFLHHLRQISQTPAIAVLDRGTEDNILRAVEAGYKSHLVNPIDAQTLQTAIAEATMESPTAAITPPP